MLSYHFRSGRSGRADGWIILDSLDSVLVESKASFKRNTERVTSNECTNLQLYYYLFRQANDFS